MTLLHELSKIDRRGALLYNREIRLLKKRGKLEFDYVEDLPEMPEDLSDLIDSFSWEKTRQGYEFWEKVLEKTEGGR
jgi:hypothetical protein